MEIITNSNIIITLNIFAVSLWCVTIIFMVKRKINNEKNETEISETAKNKIIFNETLKNKIDRNIYENSEKVHRIVPELKEVNELYKKRYVDNERIFNKHNIKNIKMNNNVNALIEKNTNNKYSKGKYKQVTKMVETGMTPFEIAKKMNRPVGEVELMMKLTQILH